MSETKATPTNASPEIIALVAIIEPLQPFFSSVLPGSSSPGFSSPGSTTGAALIVTLYVTVNPSYVTFNVKPS